MMKVSELKSFDMAECINSEEDIQIYLNMVMEENDPSELAHALGVIAKARGGMAQLAKETGLGRESLYKSLSGEVVPSFDTILKVMKALNLKFIAVPINS